MHSVSGNYWEEMSVNKRMTDKLENDLDYPPLISKLILYRNFDPFEIDLINKKIQIYNPFLKINDFEKGQKILEESISNNDKIMIIGDYDVDGCVSTSLFVNFFKLINKEADFHIPNRFNDGYGASLNLIKKIVKKKPDLIIMVDCGSNSIETIDYLKSKKIKTLIIDHHEIYKPYPKADCLINPKKECDYNEFQYFCSSALTYFLIDFFIRKKKLVKRFDDNLIYVLLATICDVMPLRKINRLIAINVLENFNLDKNYVFKKIFKKKKINRPLELEDLGFLIGPILNSAGRLNDANLVVKLLISNNKNFQEQIINKLILINEKRKDIEKKIIKEINFEKINIIKDDILIIYKNTLNEGLIGIIASKLKDYFNKPSIVLTKSDSLYKASARSTLDFNIGKHIKNCIDKNIILNGGGHSLAAGFSIKKSKIENLKVYMKQAFNKNKVKTSKKYLSKISFNSININFYNDIKTIGPFGSYNEMPLFLIEKVKIFKPLIIKNKYVSFYIKSRSGRLLPGISFNLLESDVNKNLLYYKKEIDLIVEIKENIWNNKKNLQLIVKDLIRFPNNA